MKVSSVAIVAAVLGTSTAFAQESFTLSKGRRSAGKARSDTVSSFEQCQQICNTFYGPASASASASTTAAPSAASAAGNSSVADVSASNATVTAANVSSTADASESATPSLPVKNMAAMGGSSDAASDPDCPLSADQASATGEAAASGSGIGKNYAASAAGGDATASGAAPAASSTAAAAASNATSSDATGDQAKYLDLHNQLRAKHGANPVTWDSTLADYANTYASKCVFEHSMGPYGENLAATSSGDDPITWGMNAWAEEASGYDYSSNNPPSGTGHFTQMVWKSTTAIGCAMVECPGGSVLGGGGTGYNIVCEYNPPGNFGGKYTENVGAASS